MSKTIIATPKAPAAIGPYSQAVRVGDTVYLSGQIGLDPETMQVVSGVDAQIVRVLDNIQAVVEAAGGTMSNIVKVVVLLTDLSNFGKVNEAMTKYFTQPYPARIAYAVSELPRGAEVEMDAVMYLGD